MFSEFLREYKAGRTPNPDVLCNAEIKFRAFLDHALAMGAERIATGHYAQVREVDGLYQLLKAEDGTKDQSYFLYRLNQAQLSKTLFPLGALYKRDVREIARTAGLANVAEEGFAPASASSASGRFREFLSRYFPGSRRDRHVDGPDHRPPHGAHVLHAGPAPGAGHRRHSATATATPGTSRRRTWRTTGSSSCRATNTRRCCSTG